MSTPTHQPTNTYDLQVENWALKEELEDAKEIIDTNFTRVASQAAQIHRLRQEIRTKNQSLDEANKAHSEKLLELEAEITSLKAALKQKDDDIKLKVIVANRGLLGLLDVVEDNPSLPENDGPNTTHPATDSSSHQPSSRRKRKADIQNGDFPASENISMPTQAPSQTTSNAQMDKRLAAVLDPHPPSSSTHAEPTVEQKPKRGRPPSAKRPKRSSAAGLARHDVDLPPPPRTAKTAAPPKTVATAPASPSKIVTSKDGLEESKQEPEAMVPRRGLRVKKAAKGRDMV